MVGGQVQVLHHQLEGPCEEGFSSFFFSLHASSLASSFLFYEGDLAFFFSELVSLIIWTIRTRVLEPFVDSWEWETSAHHKRHVRGVINQECESLHKI